jgi:alpha-beta hydrolase superfamily lysophospholipase
MNLHKDFTSKTIQLAPDYEGKVSATLISSNFNKGNRKSVLYIHGYIDYFFHPHVAEAFNKNDFDFYALDLRKYGRSLQKHQHPNYCKNINEYFEEISIAILDIKKENNSLFILGHSTGGLIACSYMNDGAEKNLVNGLILNSPFLDFYQSSFVKSIGYFVANFVSKLAPYAGIKGALPPSYPQSIHEDHHGEWAFNLDWKPINGFPTYFKWVVAISKAQKKLHLSNITTPILILHSSSSMKLSKYTEEAKSKDIVLNIEDMKRIGIKLGEKITFSQVDNARHDVFLSEKKSQIEAFDQMFQWLQNQHID